MNRYIIGSLWDRDNRNGTNKNFEYLFEGSKRIDTLNSRADTILSKSNATLNEAQKTNVMNKDVQNQLDSLIIESGNANAEVSQARGGLPLLKDRLDKTDSQLAQTVEEVSIIRNKEKNIFDYKHLATNNGSSNPNDWDWTVAINTAINDIVSDKQFVVLKFPAGVFKISDTVGYWAEGDIDVGLQIQGSGRSITTGNSTTIEQTNPEKNVLTFTNTRSNLRGLIIKDITLYGGQIGLNLRHNVYDLFENISFSRQSVQCIYSEIGSLNYFLNCWAAHGLSTSNFSFLRGNGTEYFVDCKIGEDTGGVTVRGANVKFINCDFHDVSNRQEIEGAYELGNNIFDVDSGGSLLLESCRITPNREKCEVVITTNNQRDCIISNCVFNLQHQTYMVSRSQVGTHQGSVHTTNNNFTWESDGNLFVNGMSTSASPLRNSILDGNTFNLPEGVNIETEDWFNRPSFNNQMGLNIIKEV